MARKMYRRRRFGRSYRRRSVYRSSRRLVRAQPLRAVHFKGIGYFGIVPKSNAEGFLLNSITRGTSISERTGNRVRNLYLNIVGGIAFNPFQTGGATGTQTQGKLENTGTYSRPGGWQAVQECSLIIAWSPVTLAAAPTLDKVYEASLNGRIDTWSLPLVTDLPTLRVIYRKNLKFTSLVSTDQFSATEAKYCAPPGIRNIRLKIPLKNVMTTYANVITAPVVGDVVAGSLWMFLLGDYPNQDVIDPTLAIPANFLRPSFNCECRLSFTDLD